jgi:regulator of RNase E activity RraA
MAKKTEVSKLKQRLSRRLLTVPGVQGVGVERGDGDDDYVLVVHVEEDDEATRNAVKQTADADAIRIVKSGRFKKQKRSP